MADVMGGQPPMMDQMNGSMGQNPEAGPGSGDPMALAAQAMPPAPGPEMQMGMPPEMQEEPEPPANFDNYIDYALMTNNLVSYVKKKKGGRDMLKAMADEIIRGYYDDLNSREGWMRDNEEWLKLATLVRENRTFPWPNASNVKYPLVATAAMQFSARAYPSLVPSTGKVVATSLPQKHPNQALYEAASRVSNHMSFQLLHRMPNWEEDMDKMLMMIAINGLMFKKTTTNTTTNQNVTELVSPQQLVVNYWSANLEDAYRKTEILNYRENTIEHKIRIGEFIKFDYKDMDGNPVEPNPPINPERQPGAADKATPSTFLACHTYWDIDGDGYEEPYVITIHLASKTVVRITARYDQDGVFRNERGQIAYIQPVEYFTSYHFIPNPDGSMYSLGFGTLLGPLNVSINTLINQLVDAGTLSNMQSGFIGKGLRIKMGEAHFRPGEWKVVNATGDDISKSIFALPVKEPSAVLFQLMNLLIQSGTQLASIAEIFVGKMPGQNTPATTTQETVQQSMAVFTAIYKRIYRSMAFEFKKLYRLNKLNPNIIIEERALAGMPIKLSDYEIPDFMIIPGADPQGDSWSMKQQKMQFVGQLIPMGTINPQTYTKRVVTDLDIPEPEELLMPPPQPQPDPKQQEMQAKMQMEQQKAQLDQQVKQQELEIKKQIAELELQKKKLELELKIQEAQMDAQIKQQESQFDMVDRVQKSQSDAQMRQLDMASASAQHQLKLRQADEAFRQKQQQAKSKPAGGAKKKE